MVLIDRDVDQRTASSTASRRGNPSRSAGFNQFVDVVDHGFTVFDRISSVRNGCARSVS